MSSHLFTVLIIHTFYSLKFEIKTFFNHLQTLKMVRTLRRTGARS